MNIITNKNKTLLDCFKINDREIEEINILVGYCRYGAFYDIANDDKAREIFLKANVKIIIGMNIDNKSHYLYSNFQNDNKEDIDKTINNFLDYTISEKKCLWS